jgi:hypothetical protein
MSTAFCDGMLARIRGFGMTANPYHVGTVECAEWIDGWMRENDTLTKGANE